MRPRVDAVNPRIRRWLVPLILLALVALVVVVGALSD
jgi:hypothetical protein